MEFTGFKSAPGAWGTDTAWHMFGPIDFNLDQVIAFAKEEEDHCVIEKLKWDMLDDKVFKVYIKNQKASYQFHLIFSTTDGKLYHQTVEYNKKTIIHKSVPLQLF